MKRISIIISVLLLPLALLAQTFSQYVDPRIGSEGLGRTFPGPSMPFGMCKPGPDGVKDPNGGWAPMPEAINGFSQTHVSGTGGGQKYGNILIQPFTGELKDVNHPQKRTMEDISLGYYKCIFENGIQTEITTAERCAFYKFTPLSGAGGLCLLVDCGHFLGQDTLIPNKRETQQFVGSEVQIINDYEIAGYSRVRGGWNDGEAYTIYFYLQSDKPFARIKTWCGEAFSDKRYQADCGKHNGAMVSFAAKDVNVKVGISCVSTLKARENIPANDFNTQLSTLRNEWEKYLSRIEIKGTEKQKRMFYTGIYHTMLMPVDRTGENPKWTESPYYDDYYAIWDTYRTSSPLLTLLCPDKERDIVNSLLNIYKREGFMPDARSGNCNGRTQGGSNAEVVIADAFVKGLEGIDYDLALEAMLKDATVAPGGNEEKEGRGGLHEYNTMGYIPYGIDRAGNRTIEYAYDDYCIALVAKGLGREDVAERFFRQSGNWKNLFRSDYEYDGMRGFIMPKDKDGRWLDDVPWGKSKVFTPTIKYTPMTKVAPWYLPWWSTFFYEATSEEYSLSIPHDVPGLITACGGNAQFKERLDLFFEKNYYNVANEPSFMTPLLYHWIDRPDLSTARVHQIIRDNYDDTPDGLPGNDDSGAMSSWLIFNMLGFYPNAGQNQYIVTAPMLEEYTIHLSNGKDLNVKNSPSPNLPRGGGNKKWGKFISHEDIMAGGEVVLPAAKFVAEKPNTKETTKVLPLGGVSGGLIALESSQKGALSFVLNRQFRTWAFNYGFSGNDLVMNCNGATYNIPSEAVENSDHFCWDSPQKGNPTYDTDGTFAFISKAAFAQLQKNGVFVYDSITWRKIGETEEYIEVRADIDRTTMRISKTHNLPLVLEMKGNPLGIDWQYKE